MINAAGELRRSAAVSTFAPGAVVDLRGDGAPLSVVMGGLEVWEQRGGSAQTIKRNAIYEPRLQKKLAVKRFLLPPVSPDDDDDGPHIAGVRFPTWLQCPSCHEVKPAGGWGSLPGKAGRYCPICTAKAPGQRKLWVVPVRFVTACAKGHLDDFPWHWWVQHRGECTRKMPLKLETRGAGLAGLVLSCTGCKAQRAMDGIFTRNGLPGIACKGRTPWLPAADEGCTEALYTTQRGASNLYFPIVESALTIPPFSERLVDLYGEYWEAIRNCEVRRRLDFIRDLWPTLPPGGYSPESVERFAALLDQKLGEEANEEDLRREEYEVLVSPEKYDRKGEEFSLRPGKPTPTLQPLFQRVSRVVRLREVRAIRAFTRLAPPSGDFSRDSTKAASLSRRPKDWLPAIEVRGEGLFVSLNFARLTEWEQLDSVKTRVKDLDDAYELDFKDRFGADALEARPQLSPRFVLVHSLAHALIRHLALDCGYSSASLRERTYASGVGGTGMAGVLIYTATTDADGTLGGLVRQGRPSRFEEVLIGSIRELRWCSSDPLCIEGLAALSDGMNGAACHACMLAAETSCEHFNRFLDRALLVGTPAQPEVGFFSELLN
jgi:hypothetical protein